MVLTKQSWLLTAGFYCLVLAFAPSTVDGAGTVAFGYGQSIDTDLDYSVLPATVSATDVDGDGDVDVIAGHDDLYNPRVDWYENLDGKGAFSDAVDLSPCCDREGPRCDRSDWYW